MTGFSLATNNDSGYQVAFGLDYSGNAYTRAEWNSKWNPWKRLAYTDSKVAGATSADTATSATKATQDGSGNVITSTYATKSSVDTLTTTVNGKQATISDLSTIRSNAQSGATAYGWGNHASMGYTKNTGTVTSVTVAGANGLTGSGTVTTSGTVTISGVTATSGATGVAKLVTGDLKSKTYANGEAAAAAHTHSQYLTFHQDISGKADKSTTLAGYGITNAYTKTEVDNKLTGYSSTSHTHKVKINGNEKTISGTTAVDLGTYLTTHQTLPTGSTSTLGMVKAGSFLSATNGTISVSTGTTSATVARGDHNHDTVYWKRTEKVASATSADTATRATYASCDGEGYGIKDTYVRKVDNTDQKVKAEASSSKIYLLGHTSSATTTSEAYKNTNVYSQNGNVYATAFYQTSDERMKTFGDEIEVDFEKLSKLRKSKFVFNNDNDKTHIGVSAQEVKEIYPEIVDEDENGYLKVDYSKLSVVALKAVDKLYEEMTEIKALIKELLNK